MSINLQKGQKVDLTKGNAGLRRVMIGLGWDAVQQTQSRGLFGRIFGGSKVESISCDAIAFLLDSNGRIASWQDVVFYNNSKHVSGCVIHQDYDLTGDGDGDGDGDCFCYCYGYGDDEQIMVDLSRLPAQYERIVILASIYKASELKQHFGMIRNAFIRLVDADTNKELCIYNLSENYQGMTAMVFGEVYRDNGEWKFNALGQPLQIWSIPELAKKYGLTY